MKKITVAHLIYRFDIGGLERVMVNCINAMASEHIEHVVISLTEVSEFANHLNDGVSTYSLTKRSGKDLACHWRLFKLLRKVKPDILHSYNLAALEYQVIARLAGVKGHIHAEHGRDSADPQGLNVKHNLLRRLVAPFVDYFVPVSTDLAYWLKEVVRLKKSKVVLIRNGIDTQHFYRQRDSYPGIHFIHVARFDLVKDQANLLLAFAQLIDSHNLTTAQAKLTLVGDGQQMWALQQLTSELALDHYVTFTGAQENIAALLANADVFVLSSIAEGIPMTVLEAMSARLAVISTNVGGLSELINDQQTGLLVEKQNSDALSHAMAQYINNQKLIEQHGIAGQAFIEQHFSEESMTQAYKHLYQHSLGQF